MGSLSIFLAFSSMSFFRDLRFIVEPLPLRWGLFLDVCVPWGCCGRDCVPDLFLSMFVELFHYEKNNKGEKMWYVNWINSPPGNDPPLSDNGLKGGTGHRDTGLSGVCDCVVCALFCFHFKERRGKPPWEQSWTFSDSGSHAVCVTALALPLLSIAISSLRVHQLGRAPSKLYLWALKFEFHVIFMYHKILFWFFAQLF